MFAVYFFGPGLITRHLHQYPSVYNRHGGIFLDILELLFPRRCVGCGGFGRYVCRVCAARLVPISGTDMLCPVCGRPAVGGRTHPVCRTKYAPDGLAAFFRYTGVMRRIVMAVKYRRVSALAKEFTALLSYEQLARMPSMDALMPVPLHIARERQRGFNQAEVLGRALAARLNMPVATAILRRVRETPPQVSMADRRQRLANMRHAFRASPEAAGMCILLFDDVFTTGATMRSAAAELKRAGARSVWIVTVAR